MSEILNRDLYAVLCDIFKGDVEVVNEGIPGSVVYDKKGAKYYVGLRVVHRNSK